MNRMFKENSNGQEMNRMFIIVAHVIVKIHVMVYGHFTLKSHVRYHNNKIQCMQGGSNETLQCIF